MQKPIHPPKCKKRYNKYTPSGAKNDTKEHFPGAKTDTSAKFDTLAKSAKNGTFQ